MTEGRSSIELGSERVEAFSDAVFAVIITILALELEEPQGHTLADVRDDLSRGLIVYALSFTMIGIHWSNSRRAGGLGGQGMRHVGGDADV